MLLRIEQGSTAIRRIPVDLPTDNNLENQEGIVKRQLSFITIAAAACFMASTAQADDITLFDYGCNVDGAISQPGGVNASGLGQIDINVAGAGAHTVICFFDHDIDAADNTFFNEMGGTGGAPAAGQTWEIDEPGFFPPGAPIGDIADNFSNSNAGTGSLLDNTNLGGPEDISMAIGFDFVLAAGESAVVSFFLDVVNGAPGFFLSQADPDSIAAGLNGPNQLFFWANLDIDQGGGGPGPMPMPEPGTIGLLGLGLIGLAGARRRQRK